MRLCVAGLDSSLEPRRRRRHFLSALSRDVLFYLAIITMARLRSRNSLGTIPAGAPPNRNRPHPQPLLVLERLRLRHHQLPLLQRHLRRRQIFAGGAVLCVAQSDSKVRCTGWGHVYLQLCIFGVSSGFFGVYLLNLVFKLDLKHSLTACETDTDNACGWSMHFA